MKNPCEDCLVQSCCIEFCAKRYAYNIKTKELYLKNKDKHLFEQAIDDSIIIFKRKYSDLPNISRQQIKEAILLKP